MRIDEYDLTGKVAFVTGAGRGIGKGIAEVLAEAGADVVINALTPEHAEPLARRLRAATGRRVVSLSADVTRRAEVERAVARILAEFGAIDVLVNNLGDAIRHPLVPRPDRAEDAALPDADLQRIVDLNFTATLLCTRVVGPHMLARRSGKVINVSSFAALKGTPELTVYAAAKAALVGFTRSLALEWAPYGIQVNAIAPGLFPDPVTVGEEGYRRRVEEAQRHVPLGREGRVREVGLLALYLASAASDYMTGQTLVLDGGWTL
jgi:NAD(P)-dependent dehydrogenase (short-subunit alcohol dehydrogenase family)